MNAVDADVDDLVLDSWLSLSLFTYADYFSAFSTIYQHVCCKCTKSYKYKWNLLRHLKYECGVAPQFICKLCHKAFTQKSSLKSHVAYVHGYQLTIK
ncbi:hypothetical protein GWI33_014881 [Rhynchophorus ferrugineus]|uniref:C2H2-type domain-containing protein n=1 Tax=Rhynchophorus ferrugineus TaxID=354439 RepID=A0A834I4C7_RHYFE|nr:hypothetical protein GWI33_014881 [Rhynchophorus ferrugineus]